MVNQHKTRRRVGNLLLAAGLVMVVGFAGCVGRTEIQAARLREQLRHTPVATDMPVAPAAQPSAAPVQPTLTLPPAADPTRPAPTPASPVLTATTAPTASSGKPTALSAEAVAARPTATVPAPTAPAPPPPATAIRTSEAAAPVRLVVPDLRIDTKVIPMGWEVIQTAGGPRSEWVIPRNEAGHHIDSALLGQQGNLVISGHNNIYGQVFKPISFAWDNDRRIAVDDYTDRSEILNGRQIQLFDAAGKAYTYVVTEFYRLKDTGVPVQQRIANGRFMQPTADARLTVITCWPPTNNTHRLIVIAQPAP